MPSIQNPKIKGYLIGIIAGVCISPDALIARLLDVDIASFIFWRALFSSLGFLCFLFYFYQAKAFSLFKNWGLAHYIIMFGQAASPTGFVIGIKLTGTVNVLVIFALAPIFTSLFSYFIWQKKIAKHTIICMFVAIIGVMIIVFDGSHSQINQGFVIPWGEIAALIATLSLSFSFCFANNHPEIHFLPVQFMGTFILALIMIPFNLVWIPSAYNLSLLLASGLLVQAVASTFLILSTRYINSTESALMLLLETMLGPILVWIVVNEVPTLLALIGGAVILTALTTNILMQLKKKLGFN